MGLATRIEKLLPDIVAVLVRFPISAGISIVLCAYVNILGVNASFSDDGSVAAGAAAAFIASGAAHLFAESRGMARVTNIGLSFAAAALAAVLGYFTNVFETSYIFLFVGLVPVLMIAPYLKDGARQGALWLFNLRFGLTTLLAIIVAALFAAGLSAIVAALNYLFNVGFDDNLYEHIWATAASLIAPIYGLSLMPRDLNEEVDISAQKDTLLARGVSVLVNYVLVPVILVYAVILHAYAVKIIAEQNLPKGQIATIVTIYALGGTGAWLIAWPWRETGTRLLRWFMRGWFWLTIVPAVLLAIAIWRRVTDYGMTPDRYGILLVAIWIACLTAYLALRRNRADMRAILGGFALLFLVGSVGPLGANGLTISSQLARFAHYLEAHGMLKDGKAVAPAAKLTSEAITEGYSFLGALQGVDALDRLAPWFDGVAKSPFKPGATKWQLNNDIAEYLGFQTPQPDPDYVNFNVNVARSLKVSGEQQLVGPLLAMQNYSPATPQLPMTALFDATTLTIKLDTATYTIGLKDFLEKTKARVSADAGRQAPVSFEIAPGVTVVIDSIYGNLNNSPPLGSARFWLILPQ